MKDIKFSRRKFIGAAAAAAATLAVKPVGAALNYSGLQAKKSGFKLKYAPPLGMFEGHAGKDPIEQLKFMADQGFTAMFDNGLAKKSPQLQKAIVKEMSRLNMVMGPFIAYANFGKKTFVLVLNNIERTQ